MSRLPPLNRLVLHGEALRLDFASHLETLCQLKLDQNVRIGPKMQETYLSPPDIELPCRQFISKALESPSLLENRFVSSLDSMVMRQLDRIRPPPAPQRDWRGNGGILNDEVQFNELDLLESMAEMLLVHDDTMKLLEGSSSFTIQRNSYIDLPDKAKPTFRTLAQWVEMELDASLLNRLVVPAQLRTSTYLREIVTLLVGERPAKELFCQTEEPLLSQNVVPHVDIVQSAALNCDHLNLENPDWSVVALDVSSTLVFQDAEHSYSADSALGSRDRADQAMFISCITISERDAIHTSPSLQIIEEPTLCAATDSQRGLDAVVTLNTETRNVDIFAFEKSLETWQEVQKTEFAQALSLGVSRDSEYLDPTVKPLPEVDLGLSVADVLAQTERFCHPEFSLSPIDSSIMEIGLAQWAPPSRELRIFEALLKLELRPRWPLKSSIFVSKAATPNKVVVPLSRKQIALALGWRPKRILELFESDASFVLPDTSDDDLMKIEEKIWILWLQQSEYLFRSGDFLYLRPLRHRTPLSTKRLRSIEEVDEVLSDTGMVSLDQHSSSDNDWVNVAWAQNCLVVPMRKCKDNFLPVFQKIQACSREDVTLRYLIVVESDSRAAELQSIFQGTPSSFIDTSQQQLNLDSPITFIAAAQLSKLVPEPSTRLSVIVDSSCTVHHSFRAASWTPEEALCRQFISRVAPQVDLHHVVVLCDQPPMRSSVLEPLLDAFKIANIIFVKGQTAGMTQIVYDVPDATKQCVKRLIAIADPHMRIMDDNVVEFAVSNVESATQALNEAVLAGRAAEIKRCYSKLGASAVAYQLSHFGLVQAKKYLASLKGISDTVKSAQEVLQPLTAESAGSLVDCLLTVLQSSWDGFLRPSSEIRILIVCPSKQDGQALLGALESHTDTTEFTSSLYSKAGNTTSVVVCCAEDVRLTPDLCSRADLTVLFALGPRRSELQIFTPIAISVDICSNELVKLEHENYNRELWLRKARYAPLHLAMACFRANKPASRSSIGTEMRIDASEVVKRFKEFENKPSQRRWNAKSPLRIFGITKPDEGSQQQMQRIFSSLKKDYHIEVIERSWAPESLEDLVIDPKTCICVIRTNQVFSGFMTLNRERFHTLANKYSRISLLVVDDRLRRLETSKEKLSQETKSLIQFLKSKNLNAEFAVTLTQSPSEEDIAKAIDGLCAKFSPHQEQVLQTWLERGWMSRPQLPGESILSNCAMLNPFFAQLILQRQPSVSALKNMSLQARKHILSILPEPIFVRPT